MRLAEAEETIRAIRAGEVDAVMGADSAGPQVFTLNGAEHAYRVLIESMNEGALMLTAGGIILYANQRVAQMIKTPLELVIGNPFRRFLTAPSRAALQPLLKSASRSGAKIQMRLQSADGSDLPVQISLRPLARNGFKNATVGMVVTDLTESRRTEELLRALSHRLVQVQEAERGRVALELHDNITQLLCAIGVRALTLAAHCSPNIGPAKGEVMQLSELLGQAAGEVERISRHLRPGVLEQLGLVAVLRDAGTEFARRTRISLKLACVELEGRLPGDIELTLYRIFQETLANVEAHASAKHVAVRLTQPGNLIQLVINDDGIGFDPDRRRAPRKGKAGLGLLSMRERATYVGGLLKVTSARHSGTEIEVRIPLPSSP